MENKTMEGLREDFFEIAHQIALGINTNFSAIPLWQFIEQNFVSKAIHESQLSELKAENEKLKIELNNMDQLQNEIGQWQDIVFPDGSTITILNHLKKEIIELDDEVKINHIQNIGKEMADCQHLLFGIAHKLQTSLYSETRKKFEINKLRKWGKPNSDGVVEHIRNEPSCRKCKHVSKDPHTIPCVLCTHNAIKEIFIRSYYQPKEK